MNTREFTRFIEAGVVTMFVYKLLAEPSAASQIAAFGNDFANALRIAVGDVVMEPVPTTVTVTEPVPTAVMDFEREYGGAGKGTAAFLSDDAESDSSYYAQGLSGAMHGRKKGIFYGGSGDSPIWGEY